MLSVGYFTEIKMLQNKIEELETKLQDEREEHRDIYKRLKEDNDMLKEELYGVRVYNKMLEEKVKELTTTDS
jgi:predicted  nucleic acid-binding Zn-ribbon protein